MDDGKGGQKRKSDLLELESQMTVSFPVGTGKGIWGPAEEKHVLLTAELSFKPLLGL